MMQMGLALLHVEPRSLFYGKCQFFVQLLVRFIRWQIKPVETRGNRMPHSNTQEPKTHFALMLAYDTYSKQLHEAIATDSYNEETLKHILKSIGGQYHQTHQVCAFGRLSALTSTR